MEVTIPHCSGFLLVPSLIIIDTVRESNDVWKCSVIASYLGTKVTIYFFWKPEVVTDTRVIENRFLRTEAIN